MPQCWDVQECHCQYSIYIYNICVHTASLIVYTYASCFTNLDLTNSWPRKPAAFREPRHLHTAFVGLIFDDKLLHPERSAGVSVLPLLIHMGQKKLWCILRRYMKILSPRQQWVYTRGTSKHSSLSKSWSSIIYEIYDHSHDGDWDHHHPNIVFFCQTPPGLSNSCSERNSFCAWSLSRCSSLRALACHQPPGSGCSQ